MLTPDGSGDALQVARRAAMTAGLRSLWGCCGLPDTENKDLVVELDSSVPFKFPEESRRKCCGFM